MQGHAAHTRGGVEVEWRRSGEGVEAEWRRSGGGVEVEWRWSGGGVEVEWRWSGGGVEVEWRWSGGAMRAVACSTLQGGVGVQKCCGRSVINYAYFGFLVQKLSAGVFPLPFV
jgi:hypothetical protein